MKTLSTLLSVNLVLAVLLMFLTACGPQVAVPATATPAATQTVGPATTPTTVPQPAPATTAPTTGPTVAPTQAAITPTVPVEDTASPQPFRLAAIAVQAPDRTVQLVTPDGRSSPFAKADQQLQVTNYLGGSQAISGTIYAITSGSTKQVVALDRSGLHVLSFIPNPIHVDAIVAGPGSNGGTPMLAWDETEPGSTQIMTQLFIAAADGSGIKSVLKETYTPSQPPLWLLPARWSQDGARLYFAKMPLGLGGYIPFAGLHDLWSYTLADGSIKEIVHAGGPTSLCIDDLSPDQRLVSDHCAQLQSGGGIAVVEVASGKVTPIAPPAELAGQFRLSGTALFSPDGSRLAYGLARGNPDTEQGWVAVTQGLSGPSKVIATSQPGGLYQVETWLDTNTLVLQYTGTNPSVWLVGADGTGLKKLADGTFLAVTNAPLGQ